MAEAAQLRRWIVLVAPGLDTSLFIPDKGVAAGGVRV
jgi:hypothetical protein